MRLIQGDCLEILPTLESSSVDAVICDPPYPEIDRPYGRMTEVEWHAMMRVVVPECHRILKPTGSAVFILQPNSRKVGSMRPWLFEFQAWCCHEWNMVQDAWWWNHETLPKTKNDPNLLRPSVKACVWLGNEDCYRDSGSVRWAESDSNRAARMADRCTNRLQSRTSRVTVRDARARGACVDAGGVTPFNLIPVGADAKDGLFPHPGRTPFALCDWWTRYISPDGGTILDPFMGSGTTGLAALARGRDFIGIERDAGYFATASKRLAEAENAMPLLRVPS
jgi:DNA modification methylase